MNSSFTLKQSIRDLKTELQVYGPPPPEWVSATDTRNRLYWYREGEDVTRTRPKPDWYKVSTFRAECDEGVGLERSQLLGMEGNCNLCLTSWQELGITSNKEGKKKHACTLIGSFLQDGLFTLGTGVGKEAVMVTGIISVLVVLQAHRSPLLPALWTSSSFCINSIAHTHSLLYDVGFGCTYKNIQMLFSSLSLMPAYSHLSNNSGARIIPTITELQLILKQIRSKDYYSLGLDDSEGFELGNRKWLGLHDVYAIMTYLGVRVEAFRILPTPTDTVYEQLFNWLVQYFGAIDVENEYTVTTRQPVFLQYAGHSVVIIGICHKLVAGSVKNVILVFDPARPIKAHIRTAARQASQSFRTVELKTSVNFDGRKDLMQEYELDSASLESQPEIQILLVSQGEKLSSKEQIQRFRSLH